MKEFSPEIRLSQRIQDLAKEAILTERPPVAPGSLRRPVGDTDYFVSSVDDRDVIAHGTIRVGDEYFIIGPLRDKGEKIPRVLQ
jgi:hypothetical protein